MLKNLYSGRDAFLLVIEHKGRLPILAGLQLDGSIVPIEPLEVHEESKGIITHVTVVQLDRGTLLDVFEAWLFTIDLDERWRQLMEFLCDGSLR